MTEWVAGMNVKVRVENPDDVAVTMTLTMPLREWLKLRDQLGVLTIQPGAGLRVEVDRLFRRLAHQITSEDMLAEESADEYLKRVDAIFTTRTL